MKHIVKVISLLALLAGLGHIFLGLAYDNPAMQMQILGGGSVYVILAVFIWFDKKIAMILSSIMMLMATVSTIPTINEMGYPVSILGSFMIINVIVIILSVVYLTKSHRKSEQ